MDTPKRNRPAAEALLGALLDATPIGVAFFDAQLRHVHVNPAYTRMVTSSQADHLGRRPDEVNDLVGRQMAAGLATAIEFGKATEVSMSFRDGTGSDRHCVGVCSPLSQTEGSAVLGVLVRDITDRTRAELQRQAALASEQQLRQDAERQRDFIRLVLENAPMAISVCEGPDYRLALVNDFALKMIGMERESILGRPLAESFPEAFTIVQETYDRVYQTGEVVTSGERLIPLPDGRRLWSYACHAPLRSADGSSIGVMALGLDVTALKQAQLIVESQKRILEMVATGAGLPAVLDAITAAVGEHSVRGIMPVVLLASKDGQHLHYASGSMPPAAFGRAIDGMPIRPDVACSGSAAFRKQRVTVEDVLTSAEWTAYRDVVSACGIRACCSTPIPGSSGDVLGTLDLYSATPGRPAEEDLRVVDLMVRMVAIAVERQSADDERARLLEAERHAREQAERANRTKDEFVATLSHELRTPLNAILGWARMLRAGELDESATARALDAIERNTRAQTQLVEDLLDISRIITGKLRLDVRSVELSGVLDSAVDAIRPAADAKNIRLQKVLDPRAAPISGDPDRLQQIVWNLLSNAIKFTPKGGRVQIRLERINSHVEIVVSDTGQGIPAQTLPHVFERFSQGVEGGGKSGGLGLGLAIARHLVELHGGTIHAASDGVDKGATFVVKLPLMVARLERADTDVHPAVSTAPSGANVPSLSGVRILVVEDDADGREIVMRVLSSAGAEVRAAESAAEAWPAIKAWKPNLLISDIEMPGEDGYGFIRRVREQSSPRELPAVALTAYARVQDRIQALAAGFQMHVPKPVEPAELIAVVKAVVQPY